MPSAQCFSQCAIRIVRWTVRTLPGLNPASPAVSLSSHVGYGNVAGFLFHKGLLSALGPSSTASSLRTPSGDVINPITGTVQGNNTELDMSDEEKEREAEKLFVLFERLEKSGVLPHDQNPVRRAAQSGRLQL
jgi:hypothetical protein